MNPQSPELCTQCGAVLPRDAPGGNCPRCLLDLGLASGSERDDLPDLPRLFGNYELLQEIARGGMGVVFRARQIQLNRIVAIKMILHGPFADPTFVKRFRVEAEAFAQLQHPDIVAIHEVGEHDGCQFFSMDFVEGHNLAALVRDQALPAQTAARYLRSIAEAVQFAHQRGILHRDLKPSNILIDPNDRPRITDFGLAKLLNTSSELTITGQVLGSPNYIPPEQTDPRFGPVTYASDVYSLGAILYHLLAGRPPFLGETFARVIDQAVKAEPVSPRLLNPAVPRDLETICLKCLAKEPKRRYPTAAALAQDLGRFLEGNPIQARPVPAAERFWLWCKRHPALALLLTAILLGSVLLIREWRQAEDLAVDEARERRVSDAVSHEARLKLYAADMSAAAEALDRGDLGHAGVLLEEHRPAPGEEDLRGFEWRLLWRRTRGRQAATLSGHAWIVTCAAFSRDGSLLATGCQDKTVKLWDVSHRLLLATLPQDGSVWCVQFTGNGKRLMTSDSGGHVRLWDLASRTVVQEFPGFVAALSPAEPWVAASESSPMWYEKSGPVTLWNWQTGQKLLTLPKPGRAVAFSPDGKLLAVGGADRGIDLWDTHSGTPVRSLATEFAPWHLAFAPDGGMLAEIGWTRDVLVWNMRRSTPPERLRGHSLVAWGAAFSPDGSLLATCGSDQAIRLWDTGTFQEKNVLRGHENEVWCVAFSPNGRILASGGKDANVMLWNPEPPPRELSFAGENSFRPIFSARGNLMATVRIEQGIWGATIVDLEKGIQSGVLTNSLPVGFSPGGDELLCVPVHQPVLETWSLPDRKLVRSLALAGTPSDEDLAFSAASDDGRHCIGVRTDGWIGLWSVQDGSLVASFQGPAPPVRIARLSPSGRWIAVTVERESMVHLFDAQSGRESLLRGHRDFISDVAFSPNERTLATASMDGTVKLWDLAKGETIATLAGHMQEAEDVAFSPDGATLASIEQGQTLKLWHVPTSRQLMSLPIPDAGWHLRFSPDGRRLAYNTRSDIVRLLVAPTLQLCATNR